MMSTTNLWQPMSQLKLTKLETIILRVAQIAPVWRNCSGKYIGEVLALQAKGSIESRVIDNQLQIRARAS